MITRFPVKWLDRVHAEDPGQYRYGWLTGFVTLRDYDVYAMIFENKKLRMVHHSVVEVAGAAEVHAKTGRK